MSTVAAPVDSVVRHEPERRVIGIGLLVLWVVALAVGLWTGPWRASPERLTADLAGHRVAAWQVDDRSPGAGSTSGPTVQIGFTWSGERYAGGAVVAWRDADGHVWWTPVDGALVPGLDDDVTPDGVVVSVPASDADRVQRAREWVARQAPGGFHDLLPWWVEVWSPVGGLATLLAVTVGPRPRYGTRWFWFSVAGLPLGIGVAAFALAEHLRPGPAHPGPPTPDGRDGRRAGPQGLGLAVAGGIMLSLTGSVVAAVARQAT